MATSRKECAMYNSQEVYDTVVQHLYAQGGKSYGDFPDDAGAKGSSGCLYRSPDGRKCAVGALIPDDIYEEAMEGLSITGLVSNYERVLPSAITANHELLGMLQESHDNYMEEYIPFDDTALYERLRDVAYFHKLLPDALDKARKTFHDKNKLAKAERERV